MARSNRLLRYGLIGTVLTALCCFTPLLVVVLGAIGLAALTPYLDFLLLPLLGLFLLITAIGLVKVRRN